MKTLNYKTLFLKQLLFVVSIGLLSLLLPACKKNKDKEKAYLSVHMTDAPAVYNAVYIDLQGVEIIGSGGTAVMLNTTAGIYNLLDFANGIDTLIATGFLDAGMVSQIRLILGPNNSIVVDNITYPLATPSAEQSGLKLLINKTLQPGVSYSILLDFDAHQSVVQSGNGEYLLKPVIRTIDTAISGSIIGSIVPVGTLATVTATSNGISYSTVVNAAGAFLIGGLPPGTYSVTVTSLFPFMPVTINGVAVTVGASSNIGIITL